jgi:hypothetical protein
MAIFSAVGLPAPAADCSDLVDRLAMIRGSVSVRYHDEAGPTLSTLTGSAGRASNLTLYRSASGRNRVCLGT